MTAEPFAPGFITGYETGVANARLLGVTCSDCEVVLFGLRDYCENCGSDHLVETELGTQGEVYSFTVQRAPPAQPFKMGSVNQEEWNPRPVGYVDVPEGVRILSVSDSPVDSLSIGDRVSLVIEPGWQNEDGNDVLVYRFATEESR